MSESIPVPVSLVLQAVHATDDAWYKPCILQAGYSVNQIFSARLLQHDDFDPDLISVFGWSEVMATLGNTTNPKEIPVPVHFLN